MKFAAVFYGKMARLSDKAHEAPLVLAPREAVVQAFPLYHKARRQAQGNMVLLPAACWARRGRVRPLGARLTALKMEIALEHFDDLFHFLAFAVQRAHLFGTQGEAIGGVVLAAVFHDKNVQPSTQ